MVGQLDVGSFFCLETKVVSFADSPNPTVITVDDAVATVKGNVLMDFSSSYDTSNNTST